MQQDRPNSSQGASLPVLAPLPEQNRDPFENETPWSVYEVFKTLVVGVTLFPLRLVVLIVTVIIGGVFVALSSLCLSHRDAASKPFGKLRLALKQPLRYAARLILWCLGFWWVTVRKRKRNVTPNVIVSNHISLSDVFCHIYLYLPSALSKMSVLSLPVVGRGAKAMQTIFIDRNSAESRQDGLSLLRSRATDTRFPPTLIFPEGTTANGKCLIDFKRGAFVSGVPVLPIVLRYPSRNYNPADTGRHSGNKSLFWLMLQFYNKLEVRELDPYYPTDAEKADPLLYARNVQGVMARALNVPCLPHSYQDFYLVELARAAKVPQTWTLWDCKQYYNLNRDQVAELLRAFPDLDHDHDGVLTHTEAVDLISSYASHSQIRNRVVSKALVAADVSYRTQQGVPLDWKIATPDDGGQVKFCFPVIVHARGLVEADSAGVFGATVGAASDVAHPRTAVQMQ